MRLMLRCCARTAGAAMSDPSVASAARLPRRVPRRVMCPASRGSEAREPRAAVDSLSCLRERRAGTLAVDGRIVWRRHGARNMFFHDKEIYCLYAHYMVIMATRETEGPMLIAEELAAFA